MIAAQDFIGVIGGVEKPFAKGQPISAADAKELGLAGKPELVEAAVAKPAKD